jgi:hypothetical protein
MKAMLGLYSNYERNCVHLVPTEHTFIKNIYNNYI